MAFVRNGETDVVTIPAGQSIVIGALYDAAAVITLPLGAPGGPLSTVEGGQRTIGPFPSTVQAQVGASKGVVEYVVGVNPQLTTQPLETTDKNSVSDARIAKAAAFAASPIVIAPARANSTPYTASESTTLSMSNGTQVLVTGNGTSAASEPTGLIDGRPLTDGTATLYSLGFRKSASDVDAPTITQSANAAAITAAGLTLFDFATGSNPVVAASSADALVYNAFAGAYIDCLASAIGVSPATGNSSISSASSTPVALPATGFAYSTALIEYDFYVEDRIFAIISANFGWTGYVLIDGKMVLPNYMTSGGTSGSGVIFDFNGVSKRRRVTIGRFAASGPQIAGVAITDQGKVTAVERNGDVMLVLGDSYNGTVAPNSAPHLGFFLKRYLGLDGLVLANVGGTGYIVKPANLYTVREVLDAAPNRLLWPYYNPRHILINTGGNDGGQASSAVISAAISAWQLAREIFPTAKITITDGNSGAGGPSANSLAIGAALASAYQQWGDANSRFIPIVSGSASTAWVTGTSHAGQALAAGNSALWTSTDATHPSPGGARYLAARLSQAISDAWDGAY